MDDLMRRVLLRVVEGGRGRGSTKVHSVCRRDGFIQVVPESKDCLDEVIALFGQEFETVSTQYGEVWVR